MQPLTLNITIETEDELRALLLRANLDADNIRQWYHGHRGKPEYIIPETRLTAIYKALKAHADENNVAIKANGPSAAPSAPAGKSVDISF